MVIIRRLIASLALLAGLASPLGADPVPFPVVYTFSFEPAGSPPASDPSMSLHPAFTFSFTLPDFVTTTGLFALPAPIAIGGETITHGGTDQTGQWIFGNGVGDRIIEGGWDLGYDTVAFAFTLPAEAWLDGYITMRTRVTGYSVWGATTYRELPQFLIYGAGTVEVAPVPEPSTLLLVGGAALLGAAHRRGARRRLRPPANEG